MLLYEHSAALCPLRGGRTDAKACRSSGGTWAWTGLAPGTQGRFPGPFPNLGALSCLLEQLYRSCSSAGAGLGPGGWARVLLGWARCRAGWGFRDRASPQDRAVRPAGGARCGPNPVPRPWGPRTGSSCLWSRKSWNYAWILGAVLLLQETRALDPSRDGVRPAPRQVGRLPCQEGPPSPARVL